MKSWKSIVAAALLALPLPALAGINNPGTAGSPTPPPVVNNQRVTVNFNPDAPIYLNIAKTWGFIFRPDNCAAGTGCTNSDGYPTATPSTVVTANPSMPANYYGTFTFSWSGTAAYQVLNEPPAIYTSISPSGAIFGLAGTSGDLGPGNRSITGASNTSVGPVSIVFQYGWLIQSISNNGSGLIRINTKTNFVNSQCWGTSGVDQNGNTGPLVNITGANVNTGANGTFAMTNCSASSFDLVGTTFTNAQAGAAGTGIVVGNNLSPRFLAQGTYSGFSNFVIAKTGDLPALAAGHLASADIVAQFKQLMNPNGTCVANHSCGWLRFMDFNGTQGNWEKDFSERVPVTALNYATRTWIPKDYWVGTITNTADALVAANPAASPPSGAYQDGEFVMGVNSSTNTTNTPTLAITGRAGAKPIYSFAAAMPSIWFILSGPPPTPGTDTMSFTFSAGAASWFNGGSNCSGTYTTQATDTSISALTGHLDAWMGGGVVGSNTPLTCLSSSLVRNGNPQGNTGNMLFQPSAQAGRLTATYTAGPAIVSVGTLLTSNLTTSGVQVYVYNYLLDGFISMPLPVFSPPMEVAVDLCNQVGCNIWWPFGTNSGGYVQGVTGVFANASTGLSSGLRFGFETGNEVWNCFGPDPCPKWKTFGNSLGISSSSNASVFNYTGLRTNQYAALARAVWTGQGRSASDFYTFIMSQLDGENVGGNFDTGQLKSTGLNISTNTWVANYGALGGGTVSTNYATQGNRPIDNNPVGIGIAPYWGSPWWGSVGSAINGTVAVNAPWLQAQFDYASGSTSLGFSEIVNTFNGVTTRTSGSAGQLMLNFGPSGSSNITIAMTQMEAIAAQYDTFRAGAGLQKVARFEYEGAPQWGFGTNPTGGTNSASDSAALTALTSQFTSLAWNVSPYVLSGNATDYAGLAQQTLTFAQAWKNDPSYANMIMSAYYQNLATISSTRENHAAQFGYNSNTWGLFPGPWQYGNNYQNFNAISTWNSGN